ncbi:hypothetical protein ACFRMQ_00135 [Kitasatospora sp. NPDC056783]|uniref:hypothetical protein n=1 Tax=Kitasatospora sp. NPDC056783 TaxID=3345943 RepID=UPI00368D2CDE
MRQDQDNTLVADAAKAHKRGRAIMATDLHERLHERGSRAAGAPISQTAVGQGRTREEEAGTYGCHTDVSAVTYFSNGGHPAPAGPPPPKGSQLSTELIDLIDAIREDLTERSFPSPVASLAVDVIHEYDDGPAYDDTLTATLLDGTTVTIDFGRTIADELVELAEAEGKSSIKPFTITLIEIPRPPKKTYTVTWVTEIDATSARHAAEKAWAAQRRRGSVANIFTTEAPDGTRVEVDLMAGTEKVLA